MDDYNASENILEQNQDQRNNVPIYRKCCLTVREAANYTGIGINTLYRKINDPNCDFVLYVQNKRLIKREALEKYIKNKKFF